MCDYPHIIMNEFEEDKDVIPFSDEAIDIIIKFILERRYEEE